MKLRKEWDLGKVNNLYKIRQRWANLLGSGVHLKQSSLSSRGTLRCLAGRTLPGPAGPDIKCVSKKTYQQKPQFVDP